MKKCGHGDLRYFPDLSLMELTKLKEADHWPEFEARVL
jgi:hypothetical protein